MVLCLLDWFISGQVNSGNNHLVENLLQWCQDSVCLKWALNPVGNMTHMEQTVTEKWAILGATMEMWQIVLKLKRRCFGLWNGKDFTEEVTFTSKLNLEWKVVFHEIEKERAFQDEEVV